MTPPRKGRLIRRITEEYVEENATLGNAAESESDEVEEVDDSEQDQSLEGEEEDQPVRRRRGGRR